MALLNRFNADALKRRSKGGEFSIAVEFCTVRKTARPGKYRSDGVGRGFLALLVLPVVAGHGAVRGL